MKIICMLFIYFILIIKENSLKSSYNYTNYNSISWNTNLYEQTLNSTISDQSVVYITSSGINIVNSTIRKTSGYSSNAENSEFYGVNAAVLVQGGEVTISGGEIDTEVEGANAVCSTNNGKINISETFILSKGENSARGLFSTYGGSIKAVNVRVDTYGKSSPSISINGGEGIIACIYCFLSTEIENSPLIFSGGGTIILTNSSGMTKGTQMIAIEGNNTVIVENTFLYSLEDENKNNSDNCGIFIYNSKVRDIEFGTSSFKCKRSILNIESSSSAYKEAPIFFITNTDVNINIEDCLFYYGSGIFLNISETLEWGASGSNGGNVTLNLIDQTIEGDFFVDNSSSLIINMINSSIIGKINTNKASSIVVINLDGNSKINLTGNSYLSSLTNEDSTGSNIYTNYFIFNDYNDNPFIATESDITNEINEDINLPSENETTIIYYLPDHPEDIESINSETIIPFIETYNPETTIPEETINPSTNNPGISEPLYGKNSINFGNNYFSISNNFDVRIKNYK